MNLGALRQRVTLQDPGVPVPDGSGGFTQTPVTLAGRVPASVEPVTARMLERVTANTVSTTTSHVVTLRYLRGVSTETQLVFHDGTTDRPMAISGVHDEAERHVKLILECEERE